MLLILALGAILLVAGLAQGEYDRIEEEPGVVVHYKISFSGFALLLVLAGDFLLGTALFRIF